jgi:2-oxoglutarate ferredoxin oxidoreductase subunit beta
MYETIKAAHAHKGFSFVHILQRCPIFQPVLTDKMTSERDQFCLLQHENGITLDESASKIFNNKIDHDPFDIGEARNLAEDKKYNYLGLFYQNKNAVRYDEFGAQNLGFTVEQKKAALNVELDKFAV